MDTTVRRRSTRRTGWVIAIGRPLAAGAKRVLPIAVVGLTLAMASGGAGASDPDKDEAKSFLLDLSDRAETVLVDQSLSAAQRRDRMEALIGSGFDLEAMSRFVLAKHWKGTSASEREEFRSLFLDYMTMTVGRHVSNIPSFELEIVALRRLGENALAVRSNLHIGEKRHTVFVDWRLRRAGGYWRIADMIVQGISFAAVIRSEFVALIDANGGEVKSLLGELRKKTTRYQSASG